MVVVTWLLVLVLMVVVLSWVSLLVWVVVVTWLLLLVSVVVFVLRLRCRCRMSIRSRLGWGKLLVDNCRLWRRQCDRMQFVVSDVGVDLVVLMATI